MISRRSPFSRRNFVGGLSATALAAPAALTSQHAMASQDHASNDEEMTVEEMDEMHREGTQAFPAETAGKGNQPLEYTMDGDVKV
ncbi:MAG TPA: twin-arginine translocation signal domain-containing protein, partial [Thermomicrobiales bacterium]|nr:twin-arginine translocation signal domain-containing protein [Thermomicrobiales bacterium]